MKIFLRTLVVTAAMFAHFAPFAAGNAQIRDSVFSDYADYDAFVDDRIMSRDFGVLIAALGARDEYTTEEMRGIVGNFMRIYPQDFTGKTVFLEEDMGGGMRREARGYFDGQNYVWFYAIMHDTGDELVVLNFRLNSSIKAILDAF